eukprot:6180578-Pleurochrysis_carterae.AAC.1
MYAETCATAETLRYHSLGATEFGVCACGTICERGEALGRTACACDCACARAAHGFVSAHLGVHACANARASAPLGRVCMRVFDDLRFGACASLRVHARFRFVVWSV